MCVMSTHTPIHIHSLPSHPTSPFPFNILFPPIFLPSPLPLPLSSSPSLITLPPPLLSLTPHPPSSPPPLLFFSSPSPSPPSSLTLPFFPTILYPSSSPPYSLPLPPPPPLPPAIPSPPTHSPPPAIDQRQVKGDKRATNFLILLLNFSFPPLPPPLPPLLYSFLPSLS